MSIEVLLIREGTKLGAANPISYDAIQDIKLKKTVSAKIWRPRNPKHNGKCWALIQAVFENQSYYATAQELAKALKIATGLFETGKTVDGLPYVEPISISFTAMDQNRFEIWYARAVDVIITKIIPNMKANNLERRVNDILNGGTHEQNSNARTNPQNS
jgi:hypothetical protein